ncbi:hypothetical protein AB0L17_34075 [Streptomyces cellulosae]
MSELLPSKPRHRRSRKALATGIPLALTAAGTLAYGADLGVLGSTAQQASAAVPAWASATADGFASVNSLGQNGTYGGRGGQIVTVKTQAELEKYATATQPYVIVVAGAINMNPVGKEIKVRSDKTIVGAGTSGHIVGGGFYLGSGVHNVIIRNLTIRDSYQGIWNDKDHDFDAIQMDGAHHVWIDHNDLRHMADGLIDVRKDSTNVTVSWNKLSDNNKTFGIGWTENVKTDITIHHNWIRETEQRNPSTDNAAHAHLYNNFLEDAPGTAIKSSYGNYSRGATKMVLENSYFKGINNPVIKDSGAAVVQRGNSFSGTSGRNESGGSAFDPKAYYPYTLDKAADLPSVLKSGAGPRGSIGTTAAASTKAAAATTLTVAKDGSGADGTLGWADGITGTLTITYTGGTIADTMRRLGSTSMEARYLPDAYYARMGEKFADKADGKRWIRYAYEDLEALTGGSGAHLGDRMRSTTPNQSVKLLLSSADLTKVGEETVRGRRATHWSGTVAAADVTDAGLKKQLTEAGVSTETVDVWIDERNLLVTKGEKARMATGLMTQTAHYADYGVRVRAERPPLSDTGDFEDLMRKQPGTS